MKYLIAGTGGVGGSIAGFLSLAGKDVTCIARGAHLQSIQTNGLKLKSDLKGEHTLRIPATTAEEFNGKADVIFVCVKGYSVDSIVELIKRAAHKDTVVIPILNVYGTGPRIQKLVPEVTVLDGCIYIVGFVSGTGEITQMGKIFRLVYGAHRGTVVKPGLLEAIQQDLQEAGIKVDLSPDINESLRMASTMFYYSKRCIILVDYNEKRMQSNGDDLIFFGKYRGHFLHEILKIDPAYLSWVAYKFIPKIPKQERFVKIAQAYHSIHLDIMIRKSREKRSSSRYLGELGEKLTDLKLKVPRVRLEDDPYKTRVNGTTPQFFVKQVLTLTDASGNLVTMSIPSKNPSAVSCTLSGIEHEYRLGDIIYVASAKVSRRYESYGSKYTRLSHVKFASLNV